MQENCKTEHHHSETQSYRPVTNTIFCRSQAFTRILCMFKPHNKIICCREDEDEGEALTELQNISVNETLDVDASWRSDDLENHQQAPCNNTASDEHSVEREVRGKKRKSNPATWKKTVRRQKRSHGEEYVSRAGITKPAKKVDRSKNCSQCLFKCTSNISPEEQDSLCTAFWRLGSEGQQHYYKHTIVLSDANRDARTNYVGKKTVARSYYVSVEGKERTRVCKKFYETSHAISHSQINTFFKNIGPDGNPGSRPTSTPANKTADDCRNLVREHINSIPRIESHYCRSTTKREYVEQSLNKAKLYRLYKEWVVSTRSATPVSEYVYGQIFDYEFNISFHKPKKDICDKCAEYDVKIKTNILTDEERVRMNCHHEQKTQTREQRKRDTLNQDTSTVMVSFDMENVFALPRTNVSSAFYKRKLNVYNMTARVYQTKKAYCAIWSEEICGRTGNDIASTVHYLLQQVIKDNPTCETLILWSDSCVPQNRNQMMSASLQMLLQEQECLVQVIHRYCEPGHSSIQDVDNLHSIIERSLGQLEIMSPISLIRHLTTLKPNGIEMHVHLMRPDEFRHYSDFSSQGTYSHIRYSEAKELTYTKAAINKIGIKKSFAEESTTFHQVYKLVKLRNSNGYKPIPTPKSTTKVCGVSKAKYNDIQSLIRFMEGVDYTYMKNIKCL